MHDKPVVHGKNVMSTSVRSDLYDFVGSESGPWIIDSIRTILGEGLSAATHLTVHRGDAVPSGDNVAWSLRGVTSNIRYTERDEIASLTARQEGIGRPEATRAALIPIRKSSSWWALAQNERRAIFEVQSKHITVGMEYLPAIARRLHHCYDLGGEFDFLTWFEYAPKHSDAFETLVRRLRSTSEWQYVDREIDIRLSRA